MTATETRPEIELEVRQEVLDLLIELGVRYDVIDGAAVVTPSATFRHERDSGWVLTQLGMQVPVGIEVLGPNYNFDGEYVETQQIHGDETLTVELPFPAEIRLSR